MALNAKMDSFTRIAAEELRRKKEPLKVYRPSAQQLRVHSSAAHELIVRGGKRSGKSVSVATEFVSRILGEPVIGPDGQPIPPRFPKPTVENPGLYWIIGWDWTHIGQTIHRLLFQRGMGKGGNFRVIRDKKTGLWRTYDPANPADAARYQDSELAGPLIPERYAKPGSKQWHWKHETAKQFHLVELQEGGRTFATICAYPSSGENPKQGDAVNGIWIDEDIQNGAFLKEWQDRLTDKDGWFMWSVWPHTSNFALIDLLDRAEAVAGDDEPQIEAVQLLMTQNPFIPAEGKKRSLERMGSEEEIARRDRGELLLDALAMYDFLPAIHLVNTWRTHDASEKPRNFPDLIRQLLTQSDRLPAEWTRYLAIDPSNTRTAILSAVVPPPEWDGLAIGNRFVVELELVLKKHSAAKCAEALAPYMGGFRYEAFVIDQNAGRQTHAGRDDSTAETYDKAFLAKGLKSRQTSSGFAYGCNVPSKRFRIVRDFLALREDGTSTLLLVENRLPETVREFRTYRKKQKETNGVVEILDEPMNPRVHDCMAALEYLAAYLEPLFEQGLAYLPREQYRPGGSPAYFAAQRMLESEKQKNEEYVHLGPGSSAAA